MTRNRRRKTAIRARQAETGTPYLVARRQLAEPAPAAPSPAAEPPIGVEVLPPLAAWTRPRDCRWWAETIAAHGPLMAVTISGTDCWWELDDLAREAAGALQDRPAQERGLWVNRGRYYVTKREHLSGIAAALDAAGALPRLTVRAVPDAAHCEHASCRRRRREPSASVMPSTHRASGSTSQPALTRVSSNNCERGRRIERHVQRVDVGAFDVRGRVGDAHPGPGDPQGGVGDVRGVDGHLHPARRVHARLLLDVSVGATGSGVDHLGRLRQR